MIVSEYTIKKTKNNNQDYEWEISVTYIPTWVEKHVLLKNPVIVKFVGNCSLWKYKETGEMAEYFTRWWLFEILLQYKKTLSRLNFVSQARFINKYFNINKL